MNRSKTKNMVYIAVCAALTAVCSWISIPATVPFTLQTFAVFLVLSLLGGKNGTAAILVYILLGAVGVPVFSGFTGGIGILLGNTGGYILGFLFMGLVYWGMEAFIQKYSWMRIPALLLGLAVCYAFGTAWFLQVYARTSGAIGLMTALGWCVIPFLIPDLVKLALAVVISSRVRRFL